MEAEMTVCPQNHLSLHIDVMFSLCYPTRADAATPDPAKHDSPSYHWLHFQQYPACSRNMYPPPSEEAQAPARALSTLKWIMWEK